MERNSLMNLWIWGICLVAFLVGHPVYADKYTIYKKVMPDGTIAFTNCPTGGDNWKHFMSVRPPRSLSASRAPASINRLSRDQYDILVRQIAAQYDVDPNLVHCVIQVESGYNPRACSGKGAIGLMQVMPQTGSGMGFSVDDLWEPSENIEAGTRYLSYMLERFNGDKRLALAAYNAGPGAVSNHGGIPPYQETQDYVSRVLQLYGGN